jgi:trimethylamine---corrinoid protein Co-methyltransferase
MRINYKENRTAYFELLSKSQLEDLHIASLEVLERTGVKILSQEARDLLKKSGAIVAEHSEIVKIPSRLVERALASSVGHVSISDRNGKPSLHVGGYHSYFGTGSDTPFIIDGETGEKRKAIKEDIARASRLCDALPNIDFVMSMGLVSDVPSQSSFLHEFEAMIVNTKKPIIFCSRDRKDLLKAVEIAALVAGSFLKLQESPFIIHYAEPISPLTHYKDPLEQLAYCAENFIPIIYTPGLSAGATAPVTLAGAVVVANCENLSGLVIHQIINPGAPFIYGGTVTRLDMSDGAYTHGTPEHFLGSCARAALGHYYNLPIFGVAGRTDAKILDPQAGIEASISILMEALSGANLIHDMGYMATGQITSDDMIVMCDEIIALVKRLLRGFEVTPETLAVDVIDQVGPGGCFLDHDHTIMNFRKEFANLKCMDRKSLATWDKEGGLNFNEKVRRHVKKILNDYMPEQLDKELCKRIQTMVLLAEKET